ncbi:MAG TPA: choice-of-anchor D domain-containing protein, partial [Gammaproteobacteria bacterium]|nr:choice-of-anchor D domain-containing protein [Gammaproteobacteria bacterium]
QLGSSLFQLQKPFSSLELDADRKATIEVKFQPLAVGEINTNLIVFSNAGQQVVKLSGSGSPTADIGLIPDRIDFGQVTLGTSAKQNLTITNNGKANLVISNITSDWAGRLSLSATSFSLPPGQSKNLLLTYTPDRTGALTGQLTISSNASQPLLPVSVQAMGIYPAPQISQVTPAVGSQAGGTQVTIRGQGFLQGVKVKIGQRWADDLTFVSASELIGKTPPGTDQVDVTVINPDQQSESLVKGFRYARVILSLTSNRYDFGQLLTGKQAETKLKISNTGEEELVVSQVLSTTDVFTAEITEKNIAAGASVEMRITFLPLTAGGFSGQIIVNSNGGQQKVEVLGSGTLAPAVADHLDLKLEPSSLPANGQSQAQLQITVKSADNRPVTNEKLFLIVTRGKVGTAVHQQGGVYQATYTAGQTPGPVKISLTTSNDKTAELNFLLTAWQVSIEQSKLQVKDGVIHGVGDPVEIQLQLRTALGEPFFAQTTRLEMAAAVKLTQPPAPTDTLGNSTAMVTSTQSGLQTIKVWLGSVILGSVAIDFQAGQAAQLGINSDKKAVAFLDSTRLNINLTDKYGNPVTSTQPVLSATAGKVSSAEHVGEGKYTAVFTAPNQEMTATITAQAGSLKQSHTIQIQRPGFSLSVAQPTVTVKKGETTASYLLQLEAEGDFTDTITLIVERPDGIKTKFAPKIVQLTSEVSARSVQLSLTFSDQLAEDTYDLIVLGFSSGGLSRMLPLQLVMKPPDLLKTALLLEIPATIVFQQPFQVSGRLLSLENPDVPVVGIPIQLKLKSGGKTVDTYQLQTDQQGKYGKEIKIGQVGQFMFEAVFAGNTELAPTEPRQQEFQVEKAVSLLEFDAAATGELGQEYRLSGQLQPNLAQESLTIKVQSPQQEISGPVSAKTGNLGVFEHLFKLDQPGDWTMTITWVGNKNYHSTTQNWQVTVEKEFGKVILVIGGGDQDENTAWSHFKETAEYVYQVLLDRRFQADDIYVLSPSPQTTKGADGETSWNMLQLAITKWAKPQVNANVPLYLYLISHNIQDEFILEKQGTTIRYLTPEVLDGWLDQLPPGTPTTLIIESCYSGNFIASADGQPSPLVGEDRTIITSADANNQSLLHRTSSFSRTFFGQIRRNKSLNQAFKNTSDWLENHQVHSSQSPQIYMTADGYLPANIQSAGAPPEIVSLTPAVKLSAKEEETLIQTELLGAKIERVFAVISSPGFSGQRKLEDWSELDQYIREVDLDFVGVGSSPNVRKYQAKVGQLQQSGVHTVVVHAENMDGMALPVQTTITVSEPALSGDINGDNSVNIFDLVIVASMFGRAGKGLSGDVNGDDSVNIFDLVIVASNFGKSTAAAAPTLLASKLTFTTQQKLSIQSAIVELENMPVRSEAEELVLSLLIAMLPERLPEQTQLLPNYPNPFNPETWIPFELSQDSAVTVTIYDIAGTPVRNISVGYLQAGSYISQSRAVYWDGKTDAGERVASGTYFYTLKTAGYVST